MHDVKDLGRLTDNYTMSRANGEMPLKDTAGRVELYQMLLMIEVRFLLFTKYMLLGLHSLSGIKL